MEWWAGGQGAGVHVRGWALAFTGEQKRPAPVPPLPRSTGLHAPEQDWRSVRASATVFEGAKLQAARLPQLQERHARQAAEHGWAPEARSLAATHPRRCCRTSQKERSGGTRGPELMGHQEQPAATGRERAAGGPHQCGRSGGTARASWLSTAPRRAEHQARLGAGSAAAKSPAADSLPSPAHVSHGLSELIKLC